MPVLKTLVDVRGTMADPVRGVTLSGLGFRDSPYTYLDAWGVPSGGDWALHRGGAVFLEGAENATVADCAFTDLDGNALFLSGYTRGVVIAGNEPVTDNSADDLFLIGRDALLFTAMAWMFIPVRICFEPFFP